MLRPGTPQRTTILVKSMLWGAILLLAPAAARAEEILGSARLQISGTRLTLDPASQSVMLAWRA